MKQAIVQDISPQIISQLDIHLEHRPLDCPLDFNHPATSCMSVISHLRSRGFDHWNIFCTGNHSVQEKYNLGKWTSKYPTIWYCLSTTSFIGPSLTPPTFLFRTNNEDSIYLYPEPGDLLAITSSIPYGFFGDGVFIQFRQGV